MQLVRLWVWDILFHHRLAGGEKGGDIIGGAMCLTSQFSGDVPVGVGLPFLLQVGCVEQKKGMQGRFWV